MGTDCSCLLSFLVIFIFFCNLSLATLSSYVIAGLQKLWVEQNSTHRQDSLVAQRTAAFRLEDTELFIWSIVCTVVYVFTSGITVVLICASKKRHLCITITWLFSSIASILMTIAVATLYILSYYGILTDIKITDFDNLNHPLEVGVVGGTAGIYTILYLILIVLVWKSYFCGSTKARDQVDVRMDYVNGKNNVEEVGSPRDEIPGFDRYTGVTPKASRRPHDLKRLPVNMYSDETDSGMRRNPSQNRVTENVYGNIMQDFENDPVYTNVVLRTRPHEDHRSNYRPNVAAKTNSNYSVEPYYEKNELETRSQRYSGQEEHSPMVDENNDPRGSLNTYANMGYENHENLYQIPRIQVGKNDPKQQ